MSGTAPKVCANCAAGHKPVWQSTSGEWVHRWQIAVPNVGSRFSICVCTAPPAKPAPTPAAKPA